MVSVRVGAVDDPATHTGLAHYLEHLMFKGTQTIGAFNWAEERFVYDSIVARYDDRALAETPEDKRAIDLEINKLTARQLSLSNQNEFTTLVQTMGGTNLNAGTSFDYTVYFNSFPKNMLPRWLELYSSRFINPVFRSFQPELETVYEEYNMYQDDENEQVRNFFRAHAFEGHPYSRTIIGEGEHLKNPQLSKLIDYYNTWYVPGNMALILVGDIRTEEVAALINRKFARLPAAPIPEEQEYEIKKLEGREQIKAKIGQIPQLVLVYDGVRIGHPDEIPLQVTTRLLSNSSQTGLLDKLSLEGDVMHAYSSLESFADHGRATVNVIPRYDYNQKRFESHRYVEKLVLEQIEKLAKGDFEEWLLSSVKNSLVRNYTRSLEYPIQKALLVSEAFISRQDLGRVLNYIEMVNAVTMEDVKEVVAKYFNDDFIAMHLDEGEDSKAENIDKPDLPDMPVEYTRDKSYYAKLFEKIPVEEIEIPDISFDDVKTGKINEKSKLFYVPNKENGVFTMRIRYGVGTRKMPELEYAVQLMNSAGVLGNYEPQEFRAALSRANATISYSVDEDYLTVFVEGVEANIVDVCGLMTRQILMPELDSKQLDNVKGSVYQNRRIEKENIDMQEAALEEFIMYGDKSDFVDRMPLEDVFSLTISDLTTAFQEATSYAAEIHYVGQLPFETVHQLLGTHLPLKKRELESQSPVDKALQKYDENKVFIFHNGKAKQSRILFYTDGEPYNPTLAPGLYAWNYYFDGGMASVVFDEIRGKNSFAYTASGKFGIPKLENNPMWFSGFVGTQGDKTNDAVDLYMELVRDVPRYEDRMSETKGFVKNALVSNKPHFREFSIQCQKLKRLGYNDFPFKTIVPAINNMAFDDVMNFYEKHLKNKPVTIGVVGNTSNFDLKALEKYGEVQRLREGDIFK
jgi:predicted Zn-dependent peptidase